MMGSRVAASLLRRGRDQASALMTFPRLPRSAPAPPPAPPRVGSCGGGGGGRHLPPPPPPQSTGGLFAASRVASYHAFRSFGPKSFMGQCTRKMSTTAAALNSNMANATANSGLKLLVTKGPQAQKAVGIWLFGCAAWVFSMVILGGVTRLTRSGLSMTDWKFAGGLPPMSEEEWLLEFQKYKQSPEYTRVNKGMNLEDFKFIYWMEYAHRMWGRALGFVFAVPFAYFVAKGYVTRQLGIRLSALFALGGAQGLIGWWMVKSGLEEPASEYVEPRVSPYRLAAHLTSAFVIYCGILWTALSVVMPDPPAESMKWVKGAAKFRKLAIPASAVVGITAISGAFVAGNDAGRAYNTFPKMGDSWIPEDVFSMEPFIHNFFENTSTVQLNHRILATSTLLSVSALWLAARKVDMHPAVKSLVGSTLGMAALQVTLGISTLLMYVPTSLGSAHQAGALTLLSLMILLTHTLRRPSPALLKSLASAVKST
ncbi:cytochrome c oxidase assembly protein COX15-like [Triticum dicoccoides]|uniref:cytochrome c oxidase assembly protein COX15-like n=1 Tax=Triticum dicoccoides TaxID=85692 RepID=UPI001891D508|nr:cytochrome c oxidase assembly protein COX15-like [Triticum dicoccoides]